MPRTRYFALIPVVVASLILLTFLLASAQQEPGGKPPIPPDAPVMEDLTDSDEVVSLDSQDTSIGVDRLSAPDAPESIEAYNAVTWTVSNALGIGVQTPSYPLDLRGAANLMTRMRAYNSSSGSAAGVDLYLHTASANGLSIQKFGPGHTSTWNGIALANWARIRAEPNTMGLILAAGGTDPLILGTADVERMRVNSTGNVGIGTAAPTHKLTVASTTSANALRLIGPTSSFGYGASLNFGDANYVYLKEDADDQLLINAFRTALMGGNTGVGTLTPATKLHVMGNRIRLENAGKVLDLRADGGAVDIQTTTSDLYVRSTGAGNDLFLQPFSNDGRVGIRTTAPATELDVNGTTRTRVLQITGGSDVAEPFFVSGQEVQPGMVVAIDPTQAGSLRIADRAYDRTVAGVVSGAGGINSGLLLQQEGSIAAGEHPVALTGRVYVWADAANGAIEPGDLLTTSNTPGHAMKVRNHALAQGAILGKAMTGLAEGAGLVLVLVSLQ